MQAFANTTIAAATGLITWTILDQLRGKKLQATSMCCGVVVGLVRAKCNWGGSGGRSNIVLVVAQLLNFTTRHQRTYWKRPARLAYRFLRVQAKPELVAP